MEPGTVGGLGVVYAAVYIIFPVLTIVTLSFICLPKRVKSAILERIDNI